MRIACTGLVNEKLLSKGLNLILITTVRCCYLGEIVFNYFCNILRMRNVLEFYNKKIRGYSMFKKILSVFTVSLMVWTSMVSAEKKAATRVADVVWADGKIYSTVLTSTSFKVPPNQSTDTLFNFEMSGLAGQRPIADSYPGSDDYNGGRWWVKMVIFTDSGKDVHDPDGDGMVNFELDSEAMIQEHLELGHIKIMGTSHYFECPLLRSRP